MGNSVKSCGCANSTIVQVKQTNGSAQEFRSRATVAHVMELNPDHLVVRYTHRKRDGEEKGGQSRIMILNPDQRLIPGKTYLLYPIPKQYIKNPCQNPFLPTESDQAEDKQDEEKLRRRTLRKLEADIELQKPNLMSFQWKPSLDSIPESPPYYTRRLATSSPRHNTAAYKPLRPSSPSMSPDAAPQVRRVHHQPGHGKKQNRWLHRVPLHPRARCFFQLNGHDIKRSRSLPSPREKKSRFTADSESRLYLSPRSEEARRKFMRHKEAKD
ncbi:hypothetical protein Mapa_015790 [Marchantia paleacea]|nr:hypothetical protein Mapa_015790 [Marchantia paleacea]